MGFGVALNGQWVAEHAQDTILQFVDRQAVRMLNSTVGHISWLRLPDDLALQLVSPRNQRFYAELLAGTAFTPESLPASAIQQGDRPYAFLLGWTVRRTVTLEKTNHVIASELTLGMLGSRLGRNVQRAIHACMRNSSIGSLCLREKSTPDSTPADPKGWDHQIMDVPSVPLGWPTARYAMSSEWMIDPLYYKGGRIRWLDAIAGPGGEVGYYTDAFITGQARVGYFTGPITTWWQNPLSSTGGLLKSQVIDTLLARSHTDTVWAPWAEGFVYVGGRGRAWGYNALLQGYPGYKGYAFPRNKIRTLTGDSEGGITFLFRMGPERRHSLQFTYEFLAARSSEFNSDLSRAHFWGGYFLSYGYSEMPAFLAVR